MDVPSGRRVPHARRRRVLALPVLAVATVATLLGGCAAGSSSDAAPEVTLDATRVLVDVRTPEEYVAGHLEGAVNVPVESPDFTERIAELDPSLEYVVYCRSGRRSEIAAEQMVAIGLEVTDLGAFDAAQRATLLAVVTP
ncbi:MAG: hypothetical protein RLZZ272_1273 [Actinomycetota bacterium]|jgi:rhodanese-related sulfurtransferase